MAELKIKATHIIKPAEKTWTGTMKLSEFDMVMARGYIPMLYLYKPSKDMVDPEAISTTLRESLEKVLVHFYPLAGRMNQLEGGRLELEVDEATWGVPLVEAETAMEMAELGDLAEAEDKGRLQHLFPVVDFRKPSKEMPLLMLQLTHFRCGGVGICITASHAVLDGISAGHFYTEWTRLARGEPLGVAPIYDRSLLRAGEPPKTDWVIKKQAESPIISPMIPPPPPPSDDFAANGPPPPSAMPPFMHTAALKLALSKSQITMLKENANHATVDGRPYSSFEVLTAHAWRCASKARGEEGDKLDSVAFAIDVRKRITPPLPQAFNGNAVIVLAATSKSEDLISKPLGYACGRVRHTVKNVTEEFIWASVDYLKAVKDLGEWRGLMTVEGDFVNPDVMMTSWLSLPFTKLDFGWGGEAHMASPPPPLPWMVYIRPGGDEGSAVVALSLPVTHADKFKEYFFQELN